MNQSTGEINAMNILPASNIWKCRICMYIHTNITIHIDVYIHTWSRMNICMYGCLYQCMHDGLHMRMRVCVNPLVLKFNIGKRH